MPKEAKVFIVDDYPAIRKLLRIFLNQEGHQVVLEASSLEDALEKTKKATQRGVEVAIIDGPLKPGGTSTDDGRAVADALRQRAPEVKIISHSSLEADWGDINFVKGDDIKGLARTITAL